jgi:hypothetical protein
MSFPAQSDVDIDTDMRRLSRTRTLGAWPTGWIQALNFYVAGGLTMAFAMALHRELSSERDRRVGSSRLSVRRYRGWPSRFSRCARYVRLTRDRVPFFSTTSNSP